jgi:hypothetical protein
MVTSSPKPCISKVYHAPTPKRKAVEDREKLPQSQGFPQVREAGRRRLLPSPGTGAIIRAVDAAAGSNEMSYYLYMTLLVVTLVLWAIIALRDEDSNKDNH